MCLYVCKCMCLHGCIYRNCMLHEPLDVNMFGEKRKTLIVFMGAFSGGKGGGVGLRGHQGQGKRSEVSGGMTYPTEPLVPGVDLSRPPTTLALHLGDTACVGGPGHDSSLSADK